MEPYIKSRAKDLHLDEIEVENKLNTKVRLFHLWVFRHTDIGRYFRKRDKDDDGRAHVWYKNQIDLLVDVVLLRILSEEWALGYLLGEINTSQSEL